MGEESIDERMPPNNTTVDEHVRDWVKRREGETKTLRSWTKIGNSTLQGVKDKAEPPSDAALKKKHIDEFPPALMGDLSNASVRQHTS